MILNFINRGFTRANSLVIKSTTIEVQSSSRRRVLHDRLTRYND